MPPPRLNNIWFGWTKAALINVCFVKRWCFQNTQDTNTKQCTECTRDKRCLQAWWDIRCMLKHMLQSNLLSTHLLLCTQMISDSFPADTSHQKKKTELILFIRKTASPKSTISRSIFSCTLNGNMGMSLEIV